MAAAAAVGEGAALGADLAATASSRVHAAMPVANV